MLCIIKSFVNYFQPPPQNLLVDLKSIRAQVPGFTVFSGDLGDK